MDFDRFAQGTSDADPTDPLALYDSLDKQHTHVELRPAQQAVLKAWALKRSERDVVIKLATGAGKTTVGLVALYSHMAETQRPCMFLCPTNQLVQQVVEEGRRCGVPAVAVLGGEELPPEALAGEALTVTSVQSIFQARAGRFESAEFYAILVDDAHAAISIVRQQFTLRIPQKATLYGRLFALFKEALHGQSSGTATEIQTGHTIGALEVPYWTWADHLPTVTQLLAEASKQADMDYRSGTANELLGLPLSWGLIKNCLHGCRCFFSATCIEITPEVPPVERVRSYWQAQKRIFMSATISDESVLVRELACDEAAAKAPIELLDAGGLGERMVLVPRLMTSDSSAVSWQELGELCATIADKKTVVVLTPSRDTAKPWSNVGAEVIEESRDVPGAVSRLRDGSLRFAAFANRYDGLDLPDESCRLLVLDGSPMAYSLMDQVDMACRGAESIRRRTVMHRIEQGLGRAVRSPSDYAVVILYGNDLVRLVSMVTTRKDLTDQTRKQIELGIHIAKDVRQNGHWRTELETLIWQCLNRDPGWKRAYQKFAKGNPSQQAKHDDSSNLEQASAERKAWNLHISNRGSEAAAVLRSFINKSQLGEDAKSFLLQRVAWYLRRENPGESLKVQTAAREQDPQLLMPSSGVQYRKGFGPTQSNVDRFMNWFKQFDQVNGAIAALDHLTSCLTFAPDASHEQFEHALQELGAILGFESRRPDRENAKGPDVLWLDGQYAVPLEAKNRVADHSSGIAKHVAAQLMQAEAWTKQVYPERGKVIPVSVHPQARCGPHAVMPPSARVLTPENIAGILDSLRIVVDAMKTAGDSSHQVAALKLAEQRLGLADLLNARTTRPT